MPQVQAGTSLPKGAIPARPDAAVAVGALVLAQLETWLVDGYEPRLGYALAAAAMTLPLAWRRIAPITMCLLIFSILVAMDLAGHPLDSAYVMMVLILALYAVGAYRDRRASVAGWIAAMALLAALIIIEAGPGLGDFLFVGSIATGAWAVGSVVRSRSEENAALVMRTTELEEDREALVANALAEERAHIARELHDVIAHSVSVVVVQTAAVRRRLQRDHPEEAVQLEAIEQTARQAMQEMRRLLGILLARETSLGLTPQPGLGDLPTLLAQMRESGLQIEFQVEGEPRPLPVGLDLVAYRVIQEALVNVLKHASGAAATVVTAYADDELSIRVSDSGNGQPPTAADPGGHGLVGMRERVLLYGGSVSSGVESSGGGFTVRARLPLGAT